MSLFGKNASRAAQHDAERAQQNQISLANQGDLFARQYQQALPNLQQIIQYYQARAGLGPGGNAQNGVGVGGVSSLFGGGTSGAGGGSGPALTGAPLGTAPGVNGGQPFAAWGSRKTLPGFQPTQAGGGGQTGLVNGSLGIFNSPQYQLLRQQAEEDIGRQQQTNQREYNALMGQRGIQGSSLQQGGQAAITAGANKSYADFVRNLAMQAADKQDQLVQQAAQSLNPSLSAGQAALGAYGQAGGLANSGIGINQAVKNQQGSAIENAFSGLGQLAYPALSSYLGGLGMPNAGSSIPRPQSSGLPIPGAPGTFGSHFAQGGHVQAGQTAIVGEKGPELYLPDPNSVPPFTAGTNSGPAGLDPYSRFLGDALDTAFGMTALPVLHVAAGGDGRAGKAPASLFDTVISPLAQIWRYYQHQPTPQDAPLADPDEYDALTQILGGNHPLQPGARPITAAAYPDYQRRAAFQAYLASLGKPIAGPPVPLPAGVAGPPVPLGVFPGRAAGGPVQAGQPYLVGEAGPEVIVPQQAGYVVPHDQLMQLHPNIQSVIALASGRI